MSWLDALSMARWSGRDELGCAISWQAAPVDKLGASLSVLVARVMASPRLGLILLPCQAIEWRWEVTLARHHEAGKVRNVPTLHQTLEVYLHWR